MTSSKPNSSSCQPCQRPQMLCILIFCSLASWARAEPPTNYTLPNGMRVIVRERHASPLVAIDLWVRAGAREEAPEETGAAHFLEHTLFKGTKTRGVGEADMAVENLGATLSAATGPDYARFYTSVASEHAADALEVVADVVRNATLPEMEIQRERQVIRDELAQRDADGEAVLIERLYSAAYPKHPYSRPPGGTEAEIRVRTRDSLAAFYHRTYTPERCTLVLVGDLTPERARSIAERAFGDWPAVKSRLRPGAPPIADSAPRAAGASERGDRGSKADTADPAPALPEARLMQETADIGRPIVGVACVAPAASDSSTACAAQIVAAMLGQSDIGGRLAVTRLAGCDARVSYAPRMDSSLLIVSAKMPLALLSHMRSDGEIAAAAAEEERVLSAVLSSLQSSPPTAAELLAAKNALQGRMIFDNETNTGLAMALGSAEVTGGDPPESWRARIGGTTLAEVRRFIALWLDPTRRIALGLLPRSPGAISDRRP